MQKKIYKISGMDCDSCAKMIELDLEDIGLTACCSYTNKTVEIEGEHNKNKVIELLKKSGYSVTHT